jgi:hypothetical protein
MLGLAVAVTVVSTLAIADGLDLLDRWMEGTATDAELASFSELTVGLESLLTLLMVASAICVLAWLFRAVSNVPALGRGTPRWSPWQSVVWWFVPVAFLVMPFLVVRDVWQRMSPAGERANGAIVGAWWLLYLGGALGGRLAAQAMSVASTVEEVRSAFVIALPAGAAMAIAGALLIAIIRTIEARAKELVGLGFATTTATVAPAAPSWGAAAPPRPAGSSESPWEARPSDGEEAATAPPAVFCPRCATARVPSMRYCASCGFDFESTGPGP